MQKSKQPPKKGMEATIKRIKYQDKQTLGEFTLFKDGQEIFNCKTLELPDLDNAFQKSHIPKGTYEVIPRTSVKFKNHYHILDVPNRTYILIHAGNYYTDILGCILVGQDFAYINKDSYLDVTNSKNTLKKILELAPKGFKLTIK
jgi:hypothetical protein